jgi:tetratricopeptide (TPR) repeat protein
MSVLLWNQDKLVEAEPYFREALEKRRRLLGEEHGDTLLSISNMGALLYAQDKLAEAETYFREALEKSRRVVGKENFATLGYVSWMGILLQARGKLDEAEPYFREALVTRRRVLPKDHPDTLIAVINMGYLLQATNKPTEAIELLTPIEAAARKAFAGAKAKRVGLMLTTLGRSRVALGYDPERFKLAEANLLEAQPMPLPTYRETRDCLQGLVNLYTAWDKAEPGKGYAAKAAEWKTKLAAVAGPPGNK